MSQVFPTKVQCAHVTTWNKKAPIKFRTNVAMMGKFGFDLNLHDLTKEELAFCKQSIKDYNRLKSVILNGDQYRLVSPYEGNHTSTMFVGKGGKKAVVFSFDIHPRYNEKLLNVKMQGLDPAKKYEVREINKFDCSVDDSKTFTGQYLMTVGLPIFTTKDLNSRIFEISSL